MSSSNKLLISQIVGFIVGLVTMTGHLDVASAASTTNLVTQDFTDIVGGVMAIISLWTLFEHLFHNVKLESQTSIKTQQVVTGSTTTQ